MIILVHLHVFEMCYVFCEHVICECWKHRVPVRWRLLSCWSLWWSPLHRAPDQSSGESDRCLWGWDPGPVDVRIFSVGYGSGLGVSRLRREPPDSLGRPAYQLLDTSGPSEGQSLLCSVRVHSINEWPHGASTSGWSESHGRS